MTELDLTQTPASCHCLHIVLQLYCICMRPLSEPWIVHTTFGCFHQCISTCTASNLLCCSHCTNKPPWRQVWTPLAPRLSVPHENMISPPRPQLDRGAFAAHGQILCCRRLLGRRCGALKSTRTVARNASQRVLERLGAGLDLHTIKRFLTAGIFASWRHSEDKSQSVLLTVYHTTATVTTLNLDISSHVLGTAKYSTQFSDTSLDNHLSPSLAIINKPYTRSLTSGHQSIMS